MQFTLKLDPETRDLVFDEAGLLETIEGDAATAQNVDNTLRAWKGEFPLDETHGTEYDRLLSQDYYDVSGDEAEEVYREAILQEDRVTIIHSLEVTISNREVAADFEADLSSGAQIAKEGTEVVRVV